ncbi:hypothetical protein Godav_019666 [Gossypium davidsonii]|uniref:Uncharacterized protein n=1 Tax=Gossypium davidsonii TaxID=34287 RepID=A0A7J8R1C1_GOSDV|nr:hypothetical protein [Gossypium davidsonii]
MPQLNTSLQFHLTPIVMINGLSRCDLLLNSQNFCHLILAGMENSLPSRLCYQRLWGIQNRRALNLGWTYYLDAFSSLAVKLPSSFALKGQSPSARGNLCMPPLPFDRPMPHRNCLPEVVPWPIGGLFWLPPKLRKKGPKPIPGNSEAS